jgi:osmotically-inducible protein OsmY
MLTAIQPTARLNPQTVEQAARARLARTGYANLKRVKCSFRNGTMILRGQVPSYYHKQLAQEALRNATHVDQVINHLEVMP